MTKKMIYLASQSPRRREILKQMGIAFKVVKSSYHEKPSRKPPHRLVIEHAVGKVKGVVLPRKKAPVLGADTIVYCRGKIFGKPKNLSQAVRMLSFLSGRAHYVYSGVAVRDPATGSIQSGYCKTKVVFRKLAKSEILHYFKQISPLDKAGAYAIQMRPSIVRKIEGSYSNVVGLPRELVRKWIRPRR